MSKKFDGIKLLRILSVILMLIIIAVAIYGDKMCQYGEEITTDDVAESYEYEEPSSEDKVIDIIEHTTEINTETTTKAVPDTTKVLPSTTNAISPEVVETVPKGYYTIACSDYELDILAATVYHEAGSNECTDRHQQLVAQVVINRVLSNEFPNTIYDVVTQGNPVQYENNGAILGLAKSKNIPQRCYDNAILALRGEVNCPYDVVWQANFVQGRGVYEKIKTSYSTSYFCYR